MNTNISITSNGMNPKQYFKIQFDFANKLAQLKNIPLAQSLLQYTNFYRRLGIKGRPTEENSMWQEYVDGIADGKDALDWFYFLYTTYKQSKKDVIEKSPFGDFGYEVDGDSVLVHLNPDKTQSVGSLKKEMIETRMGELREMFQHIRENEFGIVAVKGYSWVYNLSSYRRLFPLEYTKNPVIVQSFGGSSGWGQFFKSNGEMNQDRIDEFYKNLENLDGDNPHLVLPFQVLAVSAPIEIFYDFYGIRGK
jgi:hypothetical protein